MITIPEDRNLTPEEISAGLDEVTKLLEKLSKEIAANAVYQRETEEYTDEKASRHIHLAIEHLNECRYYLKTMIEEVSQ